VTPAPEVAVVGAGWAGLSAAVEASAAGARVTVFEMAPAAGGRARDVAMADGILDNGQHICIGAYRETLRLLRHVGIDPEQVFRRAPLTLVDAEGRGLRLPAGAPAMAFVRAVLARAGWSWRERIALLRLAARWRRAGFVCAPHATVARLTASLPDAVRRDFVEPLCVAALNTPSAAASGTVFLRVVRDALAGGRGAADLLLPRRSLGALFPAPARSWLERAGATFHLGRRVDRIDHGQDGTGWQVDGLRADRVVIATSAVEAARLARPHDAAWAARAAALRYEPIVTVYARSAGTELPEPMLALRADAGRPAQFVFDRGQLGGERGLLAFVISGAAPWVERGSAATETATLAQGAEALAPYLGGPLELARTLVEKRATFACTPGLERPAEVIACGLFAAGDYIEGPYPATLEGAVRSGVAAGRAAAAPVGRESGAIPS
jgi:hydroxysqualene dehydroxylase